MLAAPSSIPLSDRATFERIKAQYERDRTVIRMYRAFRGSSAAVWQLCAGLQSWLVARSAELTSYSFLQIDVL